MLGMKIDMNVPNVKLMEVSKLGTAVGAEDETIVGIFLEVMNDIEGSMMFLVDIPSARYLVNKLMMEDVPADKPFDEMELSALKEIGNIIAGSYFSSCSSLSCSGSSFSSASAGVSSPSVVSSSISLKFLSSMLRLYGLWQGGLACISDITWSMKIWLAMVYLD